MTERRIRIIINGATGRMVRRSMWQIYLRLPLMAGWCWAMVIG
jgi:hypothetical protein